jgi:ribose/xylose/arabinose/galactoside ABC-type transport system permease subunit
MMQANKLAKFGAVLSNNRKFLPLSATIMLFFAAYFVGAGFYDGMRQPQVFLNLFRASPYLLISAVGSTFVIISGGIDLSVSGMVALTSVASAALLRTGNWNPWVVMLLMIVMGMAMGAVMGAFITYLKVQPFIATLAGMWFARGMCFFISDDAITINNWTYTVLGQTKILIPGLSNPVTKEGDFISISVIVAMFILAAGIYIAHYTRYGRTVYAMGGGNGANEQSARLMGLPVNRTKMLVYTLNGLCSALAGITFSIYVSSGHGLYAQGFEMTVIAAVVIGGTLLTGGVGYVFGTLFGVLITGVIQTLIQFNGKLSSWWTNIAVGLLTLAFIGIQSLLAARKTRQLAGKKRLLQAKEIEALKARRNRRLLVWGGAGAIVVIVLAGLVISNARNAANAPAADSTQSTSASCEFKPYRHDQAASLMLTGAIITYERNGGSKCIDELYAFYPDGRIVGDDGTNKIEAQLTAADIDELLSGIDKLGWYTNDMYNTWHTPCGQCYGYYTTVKYNDQEKTVKAVDGGTDAPANYWRVVALINGVIPKFVNP